MTNNAGPISLASIVPCRRAATPPAPRLHVSAAPMGLAAAARASSSSSLKSLECLQSNEQARRKSPAAAFASHTRVSKSKLPLSFPHRG
jgi:hypothetical protein